MNCLSDSDCPEPIIEDQHEEEVEMDISDCDQTQSPEVPGIVLLMVTFLLKFQMIHKLSDRAITLLLFLKYFITVIGRSFNIPACISPLSAIPYLGILKGHSRNLLYVQLAICFLILKCTHWLKELPQIKKNNEDFVCHVTQS